MPFTAQLSSGRVPELVPGNELLTTSPVLDLQRGRLAATVAGGTLAGAGTFTVPLSRQRYADLDVLPIDVGGRRLDVGLDTGMHTALRLTAHGLRRAGLPADAATWRARGALSIGMGGAGQRATPALLVRLDEMAIGPVVLERPWVMLLFDESLDDADEGALGAGALLAFARVGIDRGHRVLELEPGAALERNVPSASPQRVPGDDVATIRPPIAARASPAWTTRHCDAAASVADDPRSGPLPQGKTAWSGAAPAQPASVRCRAICREY